MNRAFERVLLLAVLALLSTAGPGAAAIQQPTIPNGTYTFTDTARDWRDGGVINPEFSTDIRFWITIRNGRWRAVQRPNYPDQGPASGTYSVKRNRVVFVMLKAGVDGNAPVTAPETLKWSYFNGKLSFTIVTVADPASRVIYTAHPWRRAR